MKMLSIAETSQLFECFGTCVFPDVFGYGYKDNMRSIEFVVSDSIEIGLKLFDLFEGDKRTCYESSNSFLVFIEGFTVSCYNIEYSSSSNMYRCKVVINDIVYYSNQYESICDFGKRLSDELNCEFQSRYILCNDFYIDWLDGFEYEVDFIGYIGHISIRGDELNNPCKNVYVQYIHKIS